MRIWSAAVLTSALLHAGVLASFALGPGHRSESPIVEIAFVPAAGVQRGSSSARADEKTDSRNLARRRAGRSNVVATANPKSRRLQDREDAPPAPDRDVGIGETEGSSFTMLLRLDRLKATDYQAVVERLLSRFSSGRYLLKGTGLDLFAAVDSLFVTTPNPRDPGAAFLAARHHVGDVAMQAALREGALATHRTLAWRRDGPIVIGGWLHSPDGGSIPAPADTRVLIVDSGLVVITPPAYWSALFEPPNDYRTDDGSRGPPSLVRRVELSRRANASSRWQQLLAQTESQFEGMPPGAGVLLRFASVLQVAGSSPVGPEVASHSRMPNAVTATIGFDDGDPLLVVSFEFRDEGDDRASEDGWRLIETQLANRPYFRESGLSSLANRAEITKERAAHEGGKS